MLRRADSYVVVPPGAGKRELVVVSSDQLVEHDDVDLGYARETSVIGEEMACAFGKGGGELHGVWRTKVVQRTQSGRFTRHANGKLNRCQFSRVQQELSVPIDERRIAYPERPREHLNQGYRGRDRM